MDEVADDLPPASRALNRLGVPHEVFRHPGKVESLEQAVRERGQRPGQVVRSIVFRLGEDSFVMVLVAGAVQVSWPKLPKLVGQRRLTMASEAEVLRVTGYRIGTVSPFGLPRPLKILIDRSVLEESQVSLGCGTADTGIILSSSSLRGALQDAEIADLTDRP